MLRIRLSAILALLLILGVAPAFAEKVIIKANKPYNNLVSTIQGQGGTVTHQYKYVNAIAADIPDAALEAVRAGLPDGAIRKDHLVANPDVARDADGSRLLREAAANGAAAMSGAAISAHLAANPNAYLINNAALNLGGLHAGGKTGAGIKVAVIDSGIRPGFPHIESDGSVIGGEDFVNDNLGFSNSANNFHGTFVAGMISANVVFTFAPTSAFRNAVNANCGNPCFLNPPTNTQIPMIGSAPLSSIYALRVFGPTGGAPESRIIAAMEQVLQMRENFNNGQPETQNPDGSYDSLNIKVCNMSLGGPTLYAGRDIEDELTKAFEAKDVVLAVAAGNAGPSGITVGSPGTGFGALTVGASSTAIHERILRQLQLGPGFGPAYRPFAGTQTAYFSSRGPNADGRADPEVVANGFASYGQGSGGPFQIGLASGTSFATPTTAGVAAVLRQAHPGATSRQVRNAIILSAKPGLINDDSGLFDRGFGHVDAGAAASLLAAGAPDTPGLSGGTNKEVKNNLKQQAGITVYTNSNVSRNFSGILPGERFETFFLVKEKTASVTVTLSNFQPGSPQNVLFGNDVLLTVHTAKTSSIGEGDYPVFAFTTGGTFTIPLPEPGVMRVTVSGDWTNAAAIAGTVAISTTSQSNPGHTAKGKIEDGEQFVIPFTVPAGTSVLDARLEWKGTWEKYPTSDIDLVLVGPVTVNFDGATLNSPELASVANPEPGDWFAIVDGFTVHTNDDKYELTLKVDGNIIH